MTTTHTVTSLRARFDAESDALWAAFKAGKMTHAEYRRKLDPLEQKLRQEITEARRGPSPRSASRRDPGERLTSDITIRGRMPTALEYKEHMRLLADVAAGGRRLWDHWLGRDMSDLQHEVWVEAHRHGLVRQGRDHVHRLTPLGEVYLRQRRR